MDRIYLRETGGKREIKARTWWLSLRGSTPVSREEATAALVGTIEEAAQKQLEVRTCEAECDGKAAPDQPADGCAELCIKATACEVAKAEEMGVELKVPGITADLFYCVDHCNFEQPLSEADVSCWSSQDCSVLADQVRRLKPGECPT